MFPASFSPSLHALPDATGRTSPRRPGATLPTYFLPISWCQLRAHTQSQRPSVLITHLSCHHPWSEQEALGTPGPPPSSECDLRVVRAHGGGPRHFSPGLGEGAPSLPPLPPSPLFPAALMLEGAARRTWTMTQRRTPWCLPNGSGRAGGTAQSTVRLRLPHSHALSTASPQLPTSLPSFLSTGPRVAPGLCLSPPSPPALHTVTPAASIPCSSPAKRNCKGGEAARARGL